MKSLLYRGQKYRLAMPNARKPMQFLYTLQVQPPKGKPLQETKKKLFDLLGRAPDDTDDNLGAVEYTWGCKSEQECEKHQRAIHQQVPGAIVDYHPAV
jgi:hypothetical protein